MKLNAQRSYICLLAILAGMVALSATMLGQNGDSPDLSLGNISTVQSQNAASPEPNLGTIVGTVVDVNGDTVPNASIVLAGSDANDRRTAAANGNGYFEFHDLKPGVPYHLSINAEGFSEWSSPVITLDPGQFKILTGIQLQIQLARTTINVTQTPEEVATEQVKVEETQRVMGIIPNFYVAYEPDPVPLTAKLKFQLALRLASDPITGLGVAFLSAVQQAGDTPDYGQGAEGFGKRYGANAADGFSDIIIGGAILPSLLHQDPRYFYQGTGTKKSRFRHALAHPFICRGDKGNWMPNYSSLGGDLASSAISNLYYPQTNRGTTLVFTNFAINTAERVATSLAQEFVLRSIHLPSRSSK